MKRPSLSCPAANIRSCRVRLTSISSAFPWRRQHQRHRPELPAQVDLGHALSRHHRIRDVSHGRRRAARSCSCARSTRSASPRVRMEAMARVFPQHGPGRKHRRPMTLTGWQRALVDEHPQEFLRGLIHSDGCRVTNRFTVALPSSRRAENAYPRCFFSTCPRTSGTSSASTARS